MEYFIEWGSDSEELTDKVKALIAQGWKPTGGLAAYAVQGLGNNYKRFFQAMTREEPAKRPHEEHVFCWCNPVLNDKAEVMHNLSITQPPTT